MPAESHSHHEFSEPDDEQVRAELAEVERGLVRGIDPGRGALVIAIGGFLVVVAALLPWVGDAPGWQILLGQADPALQVGVLPRIFAATSAVFGVALSAVTLIVRRWALAFVCAILTGISCFEGMLAVWSRQTVHGAGPGFGLVLALLMMLLIAVQWFRVAWSRPEF